MEAGNSTDDGVILPSAPPTPKRSAGEIQKLYSYFSTLPMAIQVIRGPAYIYDYVNPATCTLLGKGKEELEGKSLLEIFPEETKQNFSTSLNFVYSKGDAVYSSEVPLTFLRQDQPYSGYFTISYEPLHDENDAIHGAIITAYDVTEQVKIRMRLNESEERYRVALDSAEVGCWDINPILGKVTLNNSYGLLLGLSGEESIDFENLLLLIHDQDRQRVKLAIDLAFTPASNGKFDEEYRIINRNTGDVRWVRSKGKAYFNDQGMVSRFSGTILDITERKESSFSFREQLETLIHERTKELVRSNEELTRKNQFVEAILDSSNELIGVYDIQTRFLAFNKKCEELFGMKREDVLGKKFLEVFPQSANSKGYQDLLNALQGKVIHNRHHKSTVTGRHYENLLVPLKDSSNTIYAVLVTAHDVTEREEAAEKVNDANEVLRKANQDLEQFAFIVSHDLQEPLRKIQIFAKRLLETNQHTIDEKGLTYLGKILSGSERMSEFISGLLHYSRTTREKGLFRKVSLNETLQEVLSDLELVISQKQAEIKIDTLPTLDGIGLQLHQLFYNLINNSLKFISDQKPVVDVRYQPLSTEEKMSLQLHARQAYFKITVQDNGIGFDQEYADRIFNLFYRLNGNTKYQGSGIGLSICKKIVDNHNGMIYATSQEGAGASFHIILPYYQPLTQ